VLIDGDLRRSTVAASMGLPAGAGLTDVLAGRAELTDVLQRAPQSSNLLVLAAGSVPPNPSEVLGSARMSKLLTDLAKFATVIIDAPPILPVTDAAVLTHQADGALLVVNVGKTTYDLVEKALGSLQKARGRMLGIVLNRVPMRGVNASPYAYAYTRSYTAPQGAKGAKPGSGGAKAASPKAPVPVPVADASSIDAFEALVRDGDMVAGDAANPRPRARRGQ
jgi:capsular exopolysaccharide synthesis family protein